jgi:hypothetical protein
MGKAIGVQEESPAAAPGANTGSAQWLLAIGAVVCAILIVGACFALYVVHKRLTARPDPRDTVVKYVQALRVYDWNAMRALAQPDPNLAQEEKVSRDISRRYPQFDGILKGIVQKLNIDVGKSTVEGDLAVVTVTITVAVPPAHETADVNMNWTNGKWIIAHDNRPIAKAVGKIIWPMLVNTPVGQKMVHDFLNNDFKLPVFEAEEQ